MSRGRLRYVTGTPQGLVSVVHVVDTRRVAAELSLHALAAAVDVAEARWGGVDVVIIDTTADTAVAALLDGIEGARVFDARGATRAEAFRQVLPGLRGEFVWVGGTETCCHPSSISEMVAAAKAGDSLALAAPSAPAPYAAAPVRLFGEALAAAKGHSEDLVPWLRDWTRASAEVIAVRDVGALGRKRRHEHAFGATTSVAPGSLTVGPATYSGPSTLVKNYTAIDRIELGGYCSIADEVRIINFGGRIWSAEGEELDLATRGAHREASPTSYPVGILVPDEPYDEPPAGATGERLTVGDDVWIGYGARIFGGISVGTGSIIGAGALVTKDVPPYAVVVGVPAKVLRFRFDEAVRTRLLRIGWWDWPEDIIKGAHRWLSGTTEAFVEHFDPAGGSETSIDTSLSAH